MYTGIESRNPIQQAPLPQKKSLLLHQSVLNGTANSSWKTTMKSMKKSHRFLNLNSMIIYNKDWGQVIPNFVINMLQGFCFNKVH